METLAAIFTRQSVPKVLPDPVPHMLIEQVLEAAVQAPNHYRVRPWRFVVLTGAARERLGALMAALLQKKNADLPAAALEKEAAKPLRAPVVIAVGVDLPDDARVVAAENMCAAAAAVENLLLAAHALGLAAMWRTGPAAYEPEVKEFLGFAPDQPLIAFVYLGYAEAPRPAAARPDHHDRTVWME